jgi:hypothetical protein
VSVANVSSHPQAQCPLVLGQEVRRPPQPTSVIESAIAIAGGVSPPQSKLESTTTERGVFGAESRGSGLKRSLCRCATADGSPS